MPSSRGGGSKDSMSDAAGGSWRFMGIIAIHGCRPRCDMGRGSGGAASMRGGRCRSPVSRTRSAGRRRRCGIDAGRTLPGPGKQRVSARAHLFPDLRFVIFSVRRFPATVRTTCLEAPSGTSASMDHRPMMSGASGPANRPFRACSGSVPAAGAIGSFFTPTPVTPAMCQDRLRPATAERKDFPGRERHRSSPHRPWQGTARHRGRRHPAPVTQGHQGATLLAGSEPNDRTDGRTGRRGAPWTGT